MAVNRHFLLWSLDMAVDIRIGDYVYDKFSKKEGTVSVVLGKSAAIIDATDGKFTANLKLLTLKDKPTKITK